MRGLGLNLAELSSAQKDELNIRGGLRIEAAEGAAARAGLREGDVITAVATTEVATIKEFEAALAKADKSRPINILFRRGESAAFALIRPGSGR